MKPLPLISVIVPVYNAEKDLPRCLTSLLRQTYSHLEILLLHNCSSDRSGFICDCYAKQDARVKVHHFAKNLGVSVRNYGIQWASGEYISFVDSDDFLDINTYQTAVDLIQQYPEIEAVRWGMQAILPNGQCRQNFFLSFKRGILSQEEIRSLVKEILKGKEAHNICLYLLSTNLIRQHNILFPANLLYGEDLFFTVRYLLCCHKIYSITDKLFYNYVQHLNSVTHTSRTDDTEWYINNIREMKKMLSQQKASSDLLDAFSLKLKKINFVLLYKLASSNIPFSQQRSALRSFYHTAEVRPMIAPSQTEPDTWYRNYMFWLVRYKCYGLGLISMKVLIWLRKILILRNR